MSDVFRRLRQVGLLAPLLIFSLAVPAAALADDDDDVDDRFGAWLHAGTVEDFDEEPLVRFGSLEEEDDRDDLDEFDLSDVEATIFWNSDDEDIHLTIAGMTAEPHVIVVRAENDPSSAVIAIGLIEGELDDRGELVIALQPVDGSGFAGLAHFEPEDDDDDDSDNDNDETDVDILIWEGEPVAIGTPTA